MSDIRLNRNVTSHDTVNRLSQARISQWRSSLIALPVTLILHAVLFLALPDELFMKQSVVESVRDETIELTLESPDPKTLRYVEANPVAPENEPDRSDRYSFRSQQAADENADASRDDDTPAVEGDEASVKIIQGSADPSEPAPLESGVYTLSEESVESLSEPSEPAQAPRPVLPAPEFIRQKPEIGEGPGSSLEISGFGQQFDKYESGADTPLQLYRPDSENRQYPDSNRTPDGATEARPLPRERLRVSPDLVYGPLMRSKGSASRRGALAIDATFSQFGEYEQQFYAAVQAGWYQEIDFFQPIDTSARVVVQFRIHSDGRIDEVQILDSTASEIATLICQTALTKRSPFRPWTAEMVQVFGQERVMKVAFSYR